MWQVVLATDIAEASVTIPDVTLVIDGALHRTMHEDELSPGMATLRTGREAAGVSVRSLSVMKFFGAASTVSSVAQSQ